MSLRGLYQVGYVTHDLERGIEAMSDNLGLSDFSHFDVELQLDTPDGTKSAHVRVGTAWAGNLQVELIQPVSGYIDVYAAGLPADNDDWTPCFHHVAVRRERDADMHEDVKRMALPVVFETAGNGIFSMFIDARRRLGHYIELVSASPEGWRMLGWPYVE